MLVYQSVIYTFSLNRNKNRSGTTWRSCLLKPDSSKVMLMDDIVNISLFIGFLTSQVVQDFFHQQYHHFLNIFSSTNLRPMLQRTSQRRDGWNVLRWWWLERSNFELNVSWNPSFSTATGWDFASQCNSVYVWCSWNWDVYNIYVYVRCI